MGFDLVDKFVNTARYRVDPSLQWRTNQSLLVINICRQGTVRGLFLCYLTIPPATLVVPGPCAINESTAVNDRELKQYLYNLVQTVPLGVTETGVQSPALLLTSLMSFAPGISVGLSLLIRKIRLLSD